MSTRSAEGIRLRNYRPGNNDINENSPYSSSSADQPGQRGTDQVDGSKVQPSMADVTMHLISNLPSRQLSFSHSVVGDASLDRRSSSIRATGRTPSWWNTAKRARLESRLSNLSDPEQVFDEADGLLTDEEIWEKRRTLREMPTSLSTKRQIRAQLMQQQTKHMTRINALRFRHNVMWDRRSERFRNAMQKFKVWDTAFKTIDGQFGMGVGSYFRFLKWLLFLNICILMIVLGVIISPHLIMGPNTFNESVSALNMTRSSPDPLQLAVDNMTIVSEPLSAEQRDYIQEAIDCSDQYIQYTNNITSQANVIDHILNFLQGKGFLEQTVLFYGHYFNHTYYDYAGEMETNYIMPLAYILATGAYFILSLCLMVRNSAKGFKESFIDRQSRHFQHSSKLFTAWDYCMTSEKACKQKHINLYREFTMDMENERMRILRAKRSNLVKCGLYIIRALINIVVIVILAGAGVAIFFINEKTLEWTGQFTNEFILLMIEYATPLSITALNAVIPLIFIKIVQAEQYSPEFEIKITLLRTVFLRLASLAVIIASLHGIIVCGESSYECGNCRPLQCWETYVGALFYKLAIMDLFINIAVVLCVDTPRRVCVEYFKENRVIQMLGLPEFEIPRHVLDIIYGQTLCWIGTFFCPLIPVISVTKLIIVFYLKKASLLRNYVSSARTYRASKSNSFFTVVLLVSFVLTTIPVGYSIGKIPPSKSCGPFRIYSGDQHYMFTTIGNLINSWPTWVGDIFRWLGSATMIAPLIVCLCIAMYYYYIVASGHKRMIELLKDQLTIEGRDKRFLIERVNQAMTAKIRSR